MNIFEIILRQIHDFIKIFMRDDDVALPKTIA